MPTTPVLVTVWLDPPLQSDFQVGDAVTWHASFMDRISRALVDPDTVAFAWTNPPVQNTPQAVATVHDATGLYHYDLALTGSGRWLLNVAATGTGAVAIGNATTELQVYAAS